VLPYYYRNITQQASPRQRNERASPLPPFSSLFPLYLLSIIERLSPPVACLKVSLSFDQNSFTFPPKIHATPSRLSKNMLSFFDALDSYSIIIPVVEHCIRSRVAQASGREHMYREIQKYGRANPLEHERM